MRSPSMRARFRSPTSRISTSRLVYTCIRAKENLKIKIYGVYGLEIGRDRLDKRMSATDEK